MRTWCISLTLAGDLGGAVMGTVLQIRNLALGYPELTLFRGLSMDVETGNTLAVLGANGSGKSTFVKMLLGLLQPLA